MKKIIALFALVMLMCVACQREFVLKPGDRFYIGKDKLSYVTYQSKIGNDLESALDSLQKMNIQSYPDFSFREKFQLYVNFPYDNRTFWLICFFNDEGMLTKDALDSEGNLYLFSGFID